MGDNSILEDIRALLLADEDSTEFDTDLIVHINSAFAVLSQLGAGPSDGFYIEDESEEWNDFTEDPVLQGMARMFVVLSVRLVFDSPANSFTQETLKQQIEEYKWRIAIMADSSNKEE